MIASKQLILLLLLFSLSLFAAKSTKKKREPNKNMEYLTYQPQRPTVKELLNTIFSHVHTGSPLNKEKLTAIRNTTKLLGELSKR